MASSPESKQATIHPAPVSMTSFTVTHCLSCKGSCEAVIDMTKDFTIWGIIDSEETVKRVRKLREASDFQLANKDAQFVQRNL